MKIKDIIQEDVSAGVSSSGAMAAMPTTIGSVIRRPTIFANQAALTSQPRKKKPKKPN